MSGYTLPQTRVNTAEAMFLIDPATGLPLVNSAGQFIQGNVAAGTADSGSPVKIGGVYSSTTPTLVDGQRGNVQLGIRGSVKVELVDGGGTQTMAIEPLDSDTRSVSKLGMYAFAVPGLYDGTQLVRGRGDTNGAVNQPHALSANKWRLSAGAAGIVNTTTAVTLIAAAGASVRNYITQIQIDHDLLGGVSELVVRDGAAGTIIWRRKLQTPAAEGQCYNFDVPLRSTANTLLEVVVLTAVTGGIYVNAQGYQGT